MPDVPLETWRRCFRDEYLATFLQAGGGTVKILVADDRARRQVVGAVCSDAEEAGVTVFDLTRDDVALHTMQEVWSAIAQKADWDGLTDRYLRKVCAEMGFPMDDPGIPCTLDLVCTAYGVDRPQVMSAFPIAVSDLIFRDYALDIDYRKAMAVMAFGAFSASADPHADLAKSWLQGIFVPARDLRTIQIYQRIDKTRARSILYSFVNSQYSLFGASVFVFDGSRYYTERNRSGTLRFTRPQLFELFELIRELIDEAERLRGAAVVFVFPPDFVESERRSFGLYRALLTRVADEVRGRDRGNPCAALVRVAM